MKIITLFLILLLSQNIFADIKVGKPVDCSSGQQCFNCSQFFGAWQYDQKTQKCYVYDCNMVNMMQINDNYCLSCSSDNSVTYSNGQSCVNSSDSCSQRTKAWTDSDCKLCNLGQYAVFDGQGCSQNQCDKKQSYTDQDCSDCNPQYVASVDKTKCVNTSGISCTQLKQGQQISNHYCQLCNSSSFYADLNLQSCVQSLDTCGSYQSPNSQAQIQYFNEYNIQSTRKIPWTDADCKTCGSQYALPDKTGCFTCDYVKQKNLFTDQICRICQGPGYFATSDGKDCVKSSDSCGRSLNQYNQIQNLRSLGWTQSDCVLCNVGNYVYTQQIGCFSCPSSGQSIQYNDEICQQCNGKGFFASADGLACVQSSDTCGFVQQNQYTNYFQYLQTNRKAPWTDNDCQICKLGQYAYANKQGCYTCPTDPNQFQFQFNNLNIQSQIYIEQNYSDDVCQKCFGQGYFADYHRQSCVKSSDSCQGTTIQYSSYFDYMPVRKSPWTDMDCQICKFGRLALPNKSGCYSCPNQYLNAQTFNDEICQLCYGSGYFATSDGFSCVQSKDTCGLKIQQPLYVVATFIVQRQSPWTDEDCRLCNAGQYATSDKSSCFNCITNQFKNVMMNAYFQNQITDYMCQKCLDQSYFASPIGFCVQSSDSCGLYLKQNSTQVPIRIIENIQYSINQNNQQSIIVSSNRKTAWTDQDCFLCQLGYFTNFDKSFCSPLQCSNKNQQNWTDKTCQQCGISYQLNNSSSTIIKYYASKDRKQCVQTYQSCNSTSNFTDSYCQACNQSLKSFATLDGLQCIELQDSCDSSIRKSLWNDSDCQKCKKGQHATFDKKSCAKTANCSSQKAPFTDDFCQQCSQGQQYASIDGAHCLNIKHSCKYTGVYWTEEECLLCSNNKLHVNILGTSCVQSSDQCSNRESQWTDKDCKLCYPQKNISVNDLGTECVDVNCKKTSGWTDFDCFRCNPLKPKASANKNTCTA
ncbi:hypothetical protein ABPG74_005943 [Tetrahymena malaccensis]